MEGSLHPSLRAYIDCFLSPPFPKMFPRGGGPWDQDPILMRDFRIIREHELKWKEVEDQMQSMKSGQNPTGAKGGVGGLEQGLEQYLEELGEEATF